MDTKVLAETLARELGWPWFAIALLVLAATTWVVNLLSARYLQRDIEQLKAETAKMLDAYRVQLVTETEIRKAVASKREQACLALLEACESLNGPLAGMYSPLENRYEALAKFSNMLRAHGLYFTDAELATVNQIRQAMARLTKAYSDAAAAGMTDAWLEEQKKKNAGGLSFDEDDEMIRHVPKLGEAVHVLQQELDKARTLVRRILGIQS